MTTATVDQKEIRARRAGFWADPWPVAGRALRAIPREPVAILPALVIPVFFFVVNVGALQSIAEGAAPVDFDYKAFQLPVAIIFAVTGISRAAALVTDIQDGYFDRLSMTPVSRPSLLLGLMVADFGLVIALTIPVILLGFTLGVTFATGVLGVIAFMLIAGLWGLMFAGFPYAIALKTGNPAAVSSSFLLFFPFAFLTSAFVPREQLTGWMGTIAGYNPVTYLLDALRSLIMQGWELETLLEGLAAVAAVGLVSMTLALTALRGRISRG